MELKNVFHAEFLAMVSVEMDGLNVANDVFHRITKHSLATENVTVNAWDVGGNVMGPVGMDTFLVEATTAEPIIRKALTATVMANVSTKTDSAMEAAQKVLKSVAPTDASVPALGTVEDTETVGTNASTS